MKTVALLCLVIACRMVGAEPRPVAQPGYGRLPVTFEQNTGRYDKRVRFLSRVGGGGTLFITATEAVMVTPYGAAPRRSRPPMLRGMPDPAADRPAAPSKRSVVRMKLVGGNAAARSVGLARQQGIVNYFIGNDPKKWRTRVPTFGKVQLAGVYPGIDLVYYHGAGASARRLEYDFVVRPGADPGRIRLAFSGAQRLRVADGDLVLTTPAGDLRMKRPYAYQTVGGKRVQVACDYSLQRNAAGFRLARYDASRPLVVDPVLSYSTYLGGGAYNGYGVAVAVDGFGSAHVAGGTGSNEFPTTAGAYDRSGNGGEDVFVAKLNPSGTGLVYSTYLGGTSFDRAHAIAVDDSGSAYITGIKGSDFPITQGAYDNASYHQIFISKLSPEGATLSYSTSLGGSGADSATAIALDTTRSVYVAGCARSFDFPTTPGAYDTSRNGGLDDAFACKLSADGRRLVYSTFVGGSNENLASGLAVDSAGAACVVGHTYSPDFPTTPGAVDTSYNGLWDGFIAKISADGARLIYSTYLGGTGDDKPTAVAVDTLGSAYCVGTTFSFDFPTTAGALDTGRRFGPHAFVAKLHTDGNTMTYSTFVGYESYGCSVDVARGTEPVIGGMTFGSFPTTGYVCQAEFGGIYDAFVAQLAANGATLVCGTYLGGSGGDVGTGIAVDASGSAYLTGYTGSPDFPTTAGAFDTTHSGGGDIFVTKLALGPTAAAMGLYRANLHSHTKYSDGWPGSSDSPAGAYQAARDGGLDVLAVTDHGEQLSTGEWGSVVRDAEVETTGNFVALPGFEWTHTFVFGTDWLPWLDPSGLAISGEGHINVLGASSRVGAYDKDMDSSSAVKGALSEFYAWLAVDAKGIGSGEVVAQFNHPSLYDHSEHFDDMVGPRTAEARQIVSLMELGSFGLWYEGKADGNGAGDPRDDNEYWYRRALRNGWRVAPTNGGDNHHGGYAFGTNPPVNTGIFAPPFPAGATVQERQSAILKALRARRTFASEDRDARMVLTAEANVAPQPWWMGQAIGLPASTAITLRVQASDQTDPIAKVELITPGGTVLNSLYGSRMDGWTSVNANQFDRTLQLTSDEIVALYPYRTAYDEVCIYARVTESDGQLLYAAPIWISLPSRTSTGTVTASSALGRVFARAVFQMHDGGASSALADRKVVFRADGAPVGEATTDAAGVATAEFDLLEGETSVTVTAEFAGDADAGASYASVDHSVARTNTLLYVPDRTQVITQTVALKAYLKRTSDNAWLPGRVVIFSVAGTSVGSAATSASGEAVLKWVVDAGPATRTLRADYTGEPAYNPSSGVATLTAQTLATKVYVVDRLNVKIKTYTVLKAYLYLLNNAILPGRTLTLEVDGTALGSQATNSGGYVSFGYTVPEGAGAGTRTLRATWAGNGGYTASTNTGKLGVVQGDLYLWPYVRSGKRGTIHPLKVYVRRLPDYVIQPGKAITFKVNGTPVGSANVAADGWATVSWAIPAGEATGAHTGTAEFAGDAWYAATSATGSFNVVP